MGALRWLFVAFVAGTAVHIGAIMLREPFAFDAWNVAVDTHAQPFSMGHLLDYWGLEYTHSNPRFGQVFTYLAYKLVWFAPIATPLMFLALAVAVFVIATGRWPSWRRSRDLALLIVAIGFGWFAYPHIGMIMFCRAYGTNYLYGAAIQMWFLVPLRLPRREEPGIAPTAAYFLLGLIAGACNEHTGPTLCAFMLGYAAWQWLERSPSQLVRVGALGAVAGFAAIFFAPGQNERYDGAVEKVGLVTRLLQRGLVGNFDIFRDYVIAAAPLLAILAIVAGLGNSDSIDEAAWADRRRAWRVVAFAIVCGALITATLFVSPKLGPRFFLMPMALLLAGVLAVADGVLLTRQRLAPFVALAILAGGYAAMRTLPLYARVDRESEARLAELEAAPRGATITLPSFDQVDDSWWFLGDDFRFSNKRDLVAGYFDLGGVTLRAVDLEAPLGVSDVRLVPRYELAPASCLDDAGGLQISEVRGLDLPALHAAAHGAIDQLRGRLPAGAHLERLDVTVQFAGAQPKLPRPTILLGRWTPSGYVGFSGTIRRGGTSMLRDVKPPAELKLGYELLIYQVGGEARPLGESLDYVPWKSGAYWALACTKAECFVFAVTRQI